ncbi:PAS domain-containing protein [Larkinella rosea]|uniref:PAS domain S-box protein n=1 Tax=Larkinella rosea TaxID=2025312 RepID=A0A3P1C0I1_9BACT|nr:PAS domain-containing protein [Larkinella rosea]RRB06847.1 PAS domain S-box protein [Larkinella rosea]
MAWILMQLKDLLYKIVTSEEFKALLRFFIKNRRRLTLLVVMFLLLLFIIFYNFYSISKRYEITLQKTLKTLSSENYSRGFEAYILSNVSGIQNILEAGQSKAYKDNFIKIKDELSKNKYLNNTDLHLKTASTNSTNNEIITDNYKGFLFLPKGLLKAPSNQEKFNKLPIADLAPNTLNKILDNILKRENNLREEVFYTQKIADVLHNFSINGLIEQTSLKVNDIVLMPSQVYFITQNGLNRIFKNGEKNLEAYYARQFPATIYFPSRPYYESTFEKNKFSGLIDMANSASQIPIKDFFNITGPYLDLGGNGIVYTLSRGIILENGTRGVICFDFRLNDSKLKAVCLEAFKNLNADPFIATMSMNNGSKNTELKIVEQSSFSFSKIIPQIKSFFTKDSTGEINSSIIDDLNIIISTPKGRTQILGGISVLEKGDELVVTIPISGISYINDSPIGQLMVARVNLNSLDKTTNFLVIIGLVLFFVVISLMLYAWSDDLRRKHAYQKAFARVDEVMKFSPVAYARLDDQDRILHISLAFCELLGYYHNGSLDHVIRSKTFSSLCTKESKEAYAIVQKNRELGLKVEPYDLTMVKKDGTKIEVKVISATVPSDTHGKFPETFGIAILRDDPKQNEYLNYLDILDSI